MTDNQAIRRDEMAIKPKSPTSLYHYTSGKALVSILTHGEVWFSHPRFLNDSQEWLWASKIVTQSILARAAKHRKNYLRKGCLASEFEFLLRKMLEYFNNPPFIMRNHPIVRPFIFCLSTKKDALSQWRAYGKGEYCIEFDAERLREATKATLIPIRYRKMGFDRELSQYIDHYFDANLRNISGQGYIDIETKHESGAQLQSYMPEEYFLSRKSKGFSEEQEWRLVLGRMGGEDYRREIIMGVESRYPTPHLKIKIFEAALPRAGLRPHEYPGLSPIIKSVMCGPGADPERSEASLQTLGEKLGFEIKVEFSSIPYRMT